MNTARVVKENKPNYILLDKTEEFVGVVRGVFHQEAEYPKVGDYVRYTSTAKRQAVIEEVLPRTSAVIRRVAGGTAEQVVVANVSLVFIVMALDNDFNMNRLERYVLLAEQSSVQPVVVLNKADLVSNPDSFFNQVKARFPNLSIEIVSAVTGESMEALGGYVSSDTTVVLLGSSGAGKSTITNWFMRGVVQETKEVREDDSRGRHTAVARELFSLPSGGYIIDTPGMRELGLIGEVEGDMFKEIESLMKQCKYYDYDHEKSDGSAVKGTTHEGFLSDKQFQNYLKLKKKLFKNKKLIGNLTGNINKKKEKYTKNVTRFLKEKNLKKVCSGRVCKGVNRGTFLKMKNNPLATIRVGAASLSVYRILY